MHLPVVLLVSIASLVVNAQSSPFRRSSARHPPHDRTHARRAQQQDDDRFSMSGASERDFDIVSPPLKVLPPCSDSPHSADAHEEDFDAVSPPPKVIPRSGEEFSMSGLLPLPRKITHSRRDDVPSAGGFNAVSPPPKPRSLD
jgi:hypothetical protein